MFFLLIDIWLCIVLAGSSTLGSESSDALLVNVQAHGEKLMRRHEAGPEHLQLLPSGNLVSQETRNAAKDVKNGDGVRSTMSTLTTTLSQVSSTAAGGLVAPPMARRGRSSGKSVPHSALKLNVPPRKERGVNQSVTAFEAARFSMQATGTKKESPTQLIADREQTLKQIPNDQAAFNVSGAGQVRFNGIYMPSPLSYNGGCTEFVWDLLNGNALHILYSRKVNGVDQWCLQERGQAIMYQGNNQAGSCSPELTSWAAQEDEAGTVPSVTRLNALDFTTRTTTSYTGTTAGMRQDYFVVSNAGIAGFNGVYYTTAEFAINQRCERIYAKDAPDNEEYTLRYGHPMWYFESRINGQIQRPFFGQDMGDCSPENVAWLPTFVGVQVPTVVISVTATTTTATTTTIVMACPTDYISYIGDIPGYDEFGRGNTNVLPDINTCAADCTGRSECKSFTYSPDAKMCNLKKKAIPTALPTADLKFCAKAEAAEAETVRDAGQAEAPGTAATSATTQTKVEGGAASIFGTVWSRAGLLLSSIIAFGHLDVIL